MFEEDFEEEYVWEARAEYEDGTEIERYFSYDKYKSESDQQFELEEWLISKHRGCTWYSVNLFPCDY